MVTVYNWNGHFYYDNDQGMCTRVEEHPEMIWNGEMKANFEMRRDQTKGNDETNS